MLKISLVIGYNTMKIPDIFYILYISQFSEFDHNIIGHHITQFREY